MGPIDGGSGQPFPVVPLPTLDCSRSLEDPKMDTNVALRRPVNPWTALSVAEGM
jgi:hypothetical protein